MKSLAWEVRKLKWGVQIILFSLVLSACQVTQKKLELNPLFSDHMVLQQNQEVAIWGEFTKREEVHIEASWGGKTTTRSNGNGYWKTTLQTPDAGGPFEVNIISKDSTITLHDVMVGEVWLASGESNMEMPLKGWVPNDPVDNSAAAIAGANYPSIRMFTVRRNAAVTPVDTFSGSWIVASPETAGDFSATAYFFSKKLHEELNVPIGIIHTSRGWTPAEAWTSKEALRGLKTFDEIIDKMESIERREAAVPDSIYKVDANSPAALYNAMIYPLAPYSIKGVIFYHGESSVGNAALYQRLLPTMIEDWRDKWHADFPFYFVQIAPYKYNKKEDPSMDQSPLVREAQRHTLALNNTGMVVTMDIGNLVHVHPANKEDVGARLAGLALANNYGRPLVASGPLFSSLEQSGNRLILDFESKGAGLVTSGGPLAGFEIAGADKKFVPARATIVDDKVQLTAPSISAPLYARYAWRDAAIASLFNKEGLPASSFTTE